MAKTRPEINRAREAWHKEWELVATPKMREALAQLTALPDAQFTLVLERCLDRLRIIDRGLEAELEHGPAPKRRLPAKARRIRSDKGWAKEARKVGCTNQQKK